MGINVKRADVVAAVQELAKVQGTSLTDAIGDAVRCKLDQINHRKGLASRLRKIALETGPKFREPWSTVDHGELLYDELGLPK